MTVPAPAPAGGDPAAAIVERCRALVADVTFAAVRRWKEEHPGRLAVGHLPVYVPRPLLEAQGCLPVALFGGGDELEIVRGDSYFQSYICHLPRSMIELERRGCLDVLDGVLFPSLCDVVPPSMNRLFQVAMAGRPQRRSAPRPTRGCRSSAAPAAPSSSRPARG
jgi:hypothetical protein